MPKASRLGKVKAAKKFRAGAVSKRVKLDGPSGSSEVNKDLTGSNLTSSLLSATLQLRQGFVEQVSP